MAKPFDFDEDEERERRQRRKPPADARRDRDDDDDDDDDERPARRRPVYEGSSDLMDFVTFRLMIVPFAIKILFWIGVVASIGAGIAMAVGREPLLGIVYLIAGPFVVRIYCEIIMIMFRVNDTLTELLREVQKRGRF